MSSSRNPAGSLSEPIRFGKYTLCERIGAGGMAEVFRASLETVHGFEKPVAIKRIKPVLAARRRFLELFVSEARIASTLHHPNVVQIFELGVVGEQHYIAMEYVRGCDLKKLLWAAARQGQPLPPAVVLHIGIQIARGLQHAHEATDAAGKPLGIVHHDVSPCNVLIATHGGVKLSDFGLARARHVGADWTGKLRGKLRYMPPEMIRGEEPDARSDLFSLSVALFECLTLRRLFRGKKSAEILKNIRDLDMREPIMRHPWIPPTIRPILARGLERDPDQRFEDAASMVEALEQALFDLRERVSDRNVADLVAELIGLSKPRPTPIQRPPDAPPDSQAFTAAAPPDTEIRFTVRSSDGSSFGPMSRSAAAALIRSRAIGPSDLVSVDGGQFRRAKEVAQLAPSLAQAPRRRPDADDETGRFDWTVAGSLLTRLALERATGALVLSRDGIEKSLYLRNGGLVRLESNKRSELLGAVLVRLGVLAPVQLDIALADARECDDRLGAALVRTGLVPAHELPAHLELQARLRLAELWSWSEGRYRWAPDAGPPAGRLLLTSMDLLGTIASSVMEHFAPERALELFRRAGNPRLERVTPPPFELSRLRLPPAGFRELVRLEPDGVTAQAVLDRCPPGEQRDRLATWLVIAFQTGILRGREPDVG